MQSGSHWLERALHLVAPVRARQGAAVRARELGRIQAPRCRQAALPDGCKALTPLAEAHLHGAECVSCAHHAR